MCCYLSIRMRFENLNAPSVSWGLSKLCKKTLWPWSTFVLFSFWNSCVAGKVSALCLILVSHEAFFTLFCAPPVHPLLNDMQHNDHQVPLHQMTASAIGNLPEGNIDWIKSTLARQVLHADQHLFEFKVGTMDVDSGAMAVALRPCSWCFSSTAWTRQALAVGARSVRMRGHLCSRVQLSVVYTCPRN